jgi:hypothetical protein
LDTIKKSLLLPISSGSFTFPKSGTFGIREYCNDALVLYMPCHSLAIAHAFLSIETQHFHCDWQKVETAVVSSRLPSHYHLSLLLAKLSCQLRWWYLSHNRLEWIYSFRHVHVLLYLYAYKSARDGQISTHLVEVVADNDADDSIHHHDESRILPSCYTVRNYQSSSDFGVRRLHFEFVLPLCTVLRGLLLQAKKI